MRLNRGSRQQFTLMGASLRRELNGGLSNHSLASYSNSIQDLLVPQKDQSIRGRKHLRGASLSKFGNVQNESSTAEEASSCRRQSMRYSLVYDEETTESGEGTLAEMYQETNTARGEQVMLTARLGTGVGVRMAVYDVRMAVPEVEL